MITDGTYVCSRCLDYRVVCQLCEGLEESLIPTPQWIKDEEDTASKLMRPLKFPLYH